jgi:hypothetical protein
MVNISTEYPSKYLKSADLQGKTAKLKISTVVSEQLGNDQRLIMYFFGKQKGMVLNKTNARTIAFEAGDEETDNWEGLEIEVFSMMVPNPQGQLVPGLRVRVPKQKSATVTVAPNARTRAEQPAMAGNGPAPVEAYEDGFDDQEVPF